VAVGIICDLIHVAADTLRFSIAAAGDRFLLVTDAVWLAGTEELPELPGAPKPRGATLANGAVRLPDGTLAGSACSMDQAIRNLVGIGLPLEHAVAAATSTPARVLGRHAAGVGRLSVGGRADITVLDDHLEVGLVLVSGREV
jgi:N-acetylglucosamine-6-phosphate deacetylase